MVNAECGGAEGAVARAAAREIKIRIKIRRRLGGGFGGDAGAVVPGGAFPAVPVLAGADEDFLVRPRGAKAGQIERRDVVDPLPGNRQQTQINGPPHIGPARTTGRTAKEQEVTLETVLEDQFQAQTRRRGGYGIKIRSRIRIKSLSEKPTLGGRASSQALISNAFRRC